MSNGQRNSHGNGNGPPRGWQIVEEQSWDVAVANCGTHQFFDDALAPIDYALHRNPLGLPVVPGFPNLRIAKTKLRFIGGEIIPSYRIWVRLDEQNRVVYKLWVEIAPPEDMGLWDEDDEIPF